MTAVQCKFVSACGKMLKTIDVENETLGYIHNRNKDIGLNLEKMLNCKNPQMQDVIKQGKDSSIIKVTWRYVMHSNTAYTEIFDSAEHLRSFQDGFSNAMQHIYRVLSN